MEATAERMGVGVRSRAGLAAAGPAGWRTDGSLGAWGCGAATPAEAAEVELVASDLTTVLARLGAWLARKKAVSAAGGGGGLAAALVPGAAGLAKRKVVSPEAHTPPIA